MPDEREEITLLRNAGDSASSYMRMAIARIDDQLGEGFAQKHPELVVGFMNAAALDFLAMRVGNVLERCTTRIANALDE